MELVLYPDPVLLRRAPPLEVIDEQVRERAAAMLELMYRESGVGLAAPQVGWSVRLFVMNPAGPEEREGERVFVNPRIVAASDEKEIDEEGCLSIPEVRGKVARSVRIRVEAQDLSGASFAEDLEGLPARIVQHEYDHLDGLLFVKLLSPGERLLVRKSLRQLEKEYGRERGAARGEGPSRARR